MAIDPTISDQLLASYRNAITAALDSQDRRRFQTIIKLAKQADALLGMQAERVADFNADFNNQAPDGDNLGDLIARPIAMDDMPRQIFGALAPLLQAQAEKTKADSASGAGDRLESLLRSRALLKAQKLDYKEIDAAIVVARKEL